jgi:hypothetical protein
MLGTKNTSLQSVKKFFNFLFFACHQAICEEGPAENSTETIELNRVFKKGVKRTKTTAPSIYKNESQIFLQAKENIKQILRVCLIK